MGFQSSHSPLAGSWERIVAPCKCSFIENSKRGVEETYLGSGGGRHQVPCPLGNGDDCNLRVLYINHVTGEATLHCPCATCSPEWKGVPCPTLGSLFGQDESCLLEEIDDPLIPAQDLTRVGKPCWRLGDIFNDDGTESFEYEDDPPIPAQGMTRAGEPCWRLGDLFNDDGTESFEYEVDSVIPAQDMTRVGESYWRLRDLLNDEYEEDSVIPAQDVGFHVFDDMPGFALAKNHRPSRTHQERSIASTSRSQSLTAEEWDWDPPDSRATAVSLQKPPNAAFSVQILLSLFKSCNVTRSTSLTDTPRPVSLHEVMEVSLGLSLSVLLVIIYECISIYTYIKDLPRPPPFLSKLVLLVLVLLGLRALKGNFGLV